MREECVEEGLSERRKQLEHRRNRTVPSCFGLVGIREDICEDLYHLLCIEEQEGERCRQGIDLLEQRLERQREIEKRQVLKVKGEGGGL